MDDQKAQKVERELRIGEQRGRIEVEKRRSTIDEVNTLSRLVETFVIDEEKSVIGGEIRIKNAFTPGEIVKIKAKIFKALERLK